MQARIKLRRGYFLRIALAVAANRLMHSSRLHHHVGEGCEQVVPISSRRAGTAFQIGKCTSYLSWTYLFRVHEQKSSACIGKMPATKGAATGKTLSGWDVAAFEKKIEAEQYYEAQQVVRAAAQRHFQGGDINTALKLVSDAVRSFLASGVERLAEAADLLQVAREYIEQSREARANAAALTVAEANDKIQKLCKLYALWVPRTVEEAVKKIESTRELMRVSALFNAGIVSRELHIEAAHGCFAARDYRGALQNFAAAAEPKAALLVLEDWATSARIESTEIDLLVTRAVFQFLLFRHVDAAATLREQALLSTKLGSAFKDSPLSNLTKFITAALKEATDPAAADKKPQYRSLVDLLLEHYAPALVKRDADFEAYYIPHLRRIFFGVPLPKALTQPKR